jgi:hypothetical protein
MSTRAATSLDHVIHPGLIEPVLSNQMGTKQMGAAPQPPRRLGRAVSLALAAALAAFAFSPGAVLAAGTLTVTQTAGTDCSLGRFEWSFTVSGLAAGETASVEATFGSDLYFRIFPFQDGTELRTSEVHMFGGTTSDTLSWTLYDSNWFVVSSGTATPNCAPPAPATPTTKADCDGTGWMAFPGFRNRGQCISFLNGGKASR